MSCRRLSERVEQRGLSSRAERRIRTLARLLTLGGSLIAAELASALPSTGGVYVYLTRAFSPAIGFLWGWAMFWTMHTGIIAAIAMVFARYIGVLLPMSDVALRFVAAA